MEVVVLFYLIAAASASNAGQNIDLPTLPLVSPVASLTSKPRSSTQPHYRGIAKIRCRGLFAGGATGRLYLGTKEWLDQQDRIAHAGRREVIGRVHLQRSANLNIGLEKPSAGRQRRNLTDEEHASAQTCWHDSRGRGDGACYLASAFIRCWYVIARGLAAMVSISDIGRLESWTHTCYANCHQRKRNNEAS